jgi:endonuclease-3 related protein
MAESKRLDKLLMELHRGFGWMHWWPAETPFEVIVGAILTQNTAWTNVEKALAALKAKGPLTPARLLRMKPERLARTIVSSGYYNAKSQKLAAVSRWYLDVGALPALRERPLEPLRASLLEVWGVGPETADSILCYAAGRPTAVVDAYTRRVLSRHGFLALDLPYEDIRAWLEARLCDSQFVYEEFHALFARTGYTGCKPTPRCDDCPATTPVALR